MFSDTRNVASTGNGLRGRQYRREIEAGLRVRDTPTRELVPPAVDQNEESYCPLCEVRMPDARERTIEHHLAQEHQRGRAKYKTTGGLAPPPAPSPAPGVHTPPPFWETN